VGNVPIPADAVRRRLATLSKAELGRLGKTPAESVRGLVEDVLAVELAAELEARARGLEKRDAIADRTSDVLRDALDRALAEEALRVAVSDTDIAAYFEEHRSRFEQPARVRVWRILVDSEETARKVLEEAKQAGDTAKWSELARRHSIDKATNMRQGDLGFVRADGTTDVPRVQVDPAVYRAVEGLKDGELAPEPIALGGKFAVLWRRGSLPKKSRTLDEERTAIRRVLERRRVDAARKELLVTLRRQHVTRERPELLELLPEGLLGGDSTTPVEASRASARPAEAGSIPPAPTDRGLR
jgi:peptidyl-prolyl cis-trans isomerase C